MKCLTTLVLLLLNFQTMQQGFLTRHSDTIKSVKKRIRNYVENILAGQSVSPVRILCSIFGIKFVLVDNEGPLSPSLSSAFRDTRFGMRILWRHSSTAGRRMLVKSKCGVDSWEVPWTTYYYHLSMYQDELILSILGNLYVNGSFYGTPAFIDAVIYKISLGHIVLVDHQFEIVKLHIIRNHLF
jgi:hypothetical protein